LQGLIFLDLQTHFQMKVVFILFLKNKKYPEKKKGGCFDNKLISFWEHNDLISHVLSEVEKSTLNFVYVKSPGPKNWNNNKILEKKAFRARAL